MKKVILVACLLTSTFYSVKAQTGTWSGEVELYGMKLPVVFHLDEQKPTMDVPDQSAMGIPIVVQRDVAGKISITIAATGASYRGELKDGVIEGTYTQMGNSLLLNLAPGVRKRNRPQTPKAPFPYTQEEVNFSNGDVVLKGTLTLPSKCSRNNYLWGHDTAPIGTLPQPPKCSRKTLALVMVTGSGPQNRDSELFEHKPFAVIADALTRAGFATLRYDDRGFGESTGNVASATVETSKDDALAGIEFLRKRFDRVGVIGHSEGGTIAMMLAAEGKADFIVSLAGMAVSGEETLLWQTALALSAAGVAQGDIDSYAQLLREAYSALRTDKPLPSAEGRNLSPMLQQAYMGVLPQMQNPYLKQFISLDMRPLLGGIKCPVLALNGTKDQQVEPNSNHKALRDALKGKKGSKVVAMEDLNHLFQHSTTGQMTEYRQIEETFAPEALDLIINWLKDLALP